MKGLRDDRAADVICIKADGFLQAWLLTTRDDSDADLGFSSNRCLEPGPLLSDHDLL